MNYKEAISTPTLPPPKATESQYLSIDEAYKQLQVQLMRKPIPSPPKRSLVLGDASDHVANIYEQLTSYWKTKGYLAKATVTSFSDMLKDAFQVQYIPSEDEQGTPNPST
jgi:hypothetical protein